MKKIKYFFTLGLIGFFCFSAPKLIRAENLKITYDGVSHEYSGVQVKYSFQGKELPSSYPGIIIDGISIASIDETFGKAGIGLQYKFDKKLGTITIKNGKDVLEMKVGSFEAKVNKEVKWMPLAPGLIKFSDGKEKLYVPARFTASSLSLFYTWYSKTGTALIEGKVEKPKSSVEKKKNKGKDNVAEKGKENSKETKTKNNNKKKKSKVKSEISINGKTFDYKKDKVIFYAGKKRLNASTHPGIYLDSVLMAPAKELFLNEEMEGGYSYKKKDKKLTLEFEDKVLQMYLDSKEALLNQEKIKLKKAPVEVSYLFSGKTSILFPIEEIGDLFRWKITVESNSARIDLPVWSEEISEEQTQVEGSQNEEKNQTTDSKEGENTSLNQNEKNVSEGSQIGNITSQKPSKGKRLFRWKSKEKINSGKKNHSITYNKGSNEEDSLEKNENISKVSDIIQLENQQNGKFNVYQIITDQEFYQIDSELNEKELVLNLSDFEQTENKNFFFQNGGLSNKAELKTEEGMVKVKFSLAENLADFDLKLSDDKKILTITFFRNVIISIEGERKDGTSRVILKGSGRISIESLDRLDSEFLNFTIKGVTDGIGEKSFLNKKILEELKSLKYQADGDKLMLSIQKGVGYGYSIQNGEKESVILIEKLENMQFDIQIPLPFDLESLPLEDEDDYLNKKISVILPVDITDFLKNTPIFLNNEKILGVELFTNVEGKTKVTLSFEEMFAYRLYKTKDFIGVKLGKANEFYKKVIVLDPGHGDHDTGAISVDKKYKEKDIVLAVGHTFLKDKFKDSDIKVYWTREGNTFMSLKDRAHFASQIGADLFVSIHANAASNKKALGTETYYSVRNNNILPNGLSSYVMAGLFQKNLTSGMKTVNRGVKSNVFVVTNINTVPAVLLELGFMTNSKDIAMLSSPEKQEKMSEILYQTIVDLFEKYPTGR